MATLDQYSSTGLDRSLCLLFLSLFKKKKMFPASSMFAFPPNNAITRIQSSVLLLGASDAVLKERTLLRRTRANNSNGQRDTYPALQRVHGSQSIWYHLWRKKSCSIPEVLDHVEF